VGQDLEQVVGEPGFAARLSSQMERIAASVHPSEVTSVVEDISRSLCCNGAVFASFAKEDEDFETYRYIVACEAQWCTLYLARRWFVIDPYLHYAQTHSEPIAADDVPLRTDGQRLFRQHANEQGYKSIAIVPAHTATGRARMGVLYLTSDDPNYFTSDSIRPAKLFLRA
jgi:hypothetical protein